tara:strand:+ start:1070 stop:1216 length:147 start_codon:yes stop_codon:yes gene_type:complete
MGIIIENMKSFFMKGKKIIPANIGVKFGGCGTTLLKTRSKVKKIMPFR